MGHPQAEGTRRWISLRRSFPAPTSLTSLLLSISVSQHPGSRDESFQPWRESAAAAVLNSSQFTWTAIEWWRGGCVGVSQRFIFAVRMVLGSVGGGWAPAAKVYVASAVHRCQFPLAEGWIFPHGCEGITVSGQLPSLGCFNTSLFWTGYKSEKPWSRRAHWLCQEDDLRKIKNNHIVFFFSKKKSCWISGYSVWGKE